MFRVLGGGAEEESEVRSIIGDFLGATNGAGRDGGGFCAGRVRDLSAATGWAVTGVFA